MKRRISRAKKIQQNKRNNEEKNKKQKYENNQLFRMENRPSIFLTKFFDPSII